MNPEQAQELGRFLRSRREARQLSLRQLSALAHVDDGTITRIEQGKFAAPAPDKLSRLAEALGLNLGDVYAMADYAVPQDLPALSPYLRTKYRDLPPEASEAIERYAVRLAKRHGVDLSGPTPGEDEAAEAEPQTTTTRKARKKGGSHAK